MQLIGILGMKSTTASALSENARLFPDAPDYTQAQRFIPRLA